MIITEALSFEDYLKEINDPWTTRCLDEKTNLWAFHPQRNYDYVKRQYDAFRTDTKELLLVDKRQTAQVGDNVRYDINTDEFIIHNIAKVKANG